MRQETYRFALDEATKELHDIVAQFDALRSRKEQIEAVVEALRPFIGLHAETATPTIEASAPIAEFVAPAIEQPAPEPEPQFTFMQVSGPGMEVVATEPVPVAVEPEPEPVLETVAVHADDATAEQIAYFRQPSADPFQRRIDDALWGWQQRPEGLLSPI
ncbi:hypothetical protein [Occallatibacter savannae]|uniref:hypothetical protein n=1 Tax=Occallatibacter savannae TaxID=1002691 RepID=UPI000D6938A7|nr:hypothetical protein [Occallatibacter savannae]